MLCAGNSELREVDIKQGNFQGDSLSPLALILLSRILRKAKAQYMSFQGTKRRLITFYLWMI